MTEIHLEWINGFPFPSFGKSHRSDIPADLRNKFEQIGFVALELAYTAGQQSEPWNPEITGIMRNTQTRAFLLDWLREQH